MKRDQLTYTPPVEKLRGMRWCIKTLRNPPSREALSRALCDTVRHYEDRGAQLQFGFGCYLPTGCRVTMTLIRGDMPEATWELAAQALRIIEQGEPAEVCAATESTAP